MNLSMCNVGLLSFPYGVSTMLDTQQIFMLTRPSPGHFMYHVLLNLLDFADVSRSSMNKMTHGRANYKVNSY